MISKQHRTNKIQTGARAMLYLPTKSIKTQNEAEVTSLQTMVTDINQSLQHLPGKWSQGSYCVLANGDCPAGFTKKSGVIRAIKNIAGDYRYIKEEQFGDSKISCHATCGDPNNWNADIYIVTCCK